MTNELAKKESESLVPNANNLRLLAKDFLDSGMFPAAKSIAGVVTIIEYGRELGLPPAVALQTMSIVSGKICLEAKVMLGLFQKAGGQIEIIKKDKEGSKVRLSKEGRQPFEESFTIDDAKALGFLSKTNWKLYPEEMCYWRCIAKGIRAYDPNVTMGIYSVEEMKDVEVEAKKEKIAKEITGILQNAAKPATAEVVTEATPEPDAQNNPPEATPADDGFQDAEYADEDKGDTPTDDKPFDERKDLGRVIHKALGALGVSTAEQKKSFLDWLFEYGEKRKKHYCGIGEDGEIHLSLGDLEDMKALLKQAKQAVTTWEKERGK